MGKPGRERLDGRTIGEAAQQAHRRALQSTDPKLTGRDLRLLFAIENLTLEYHRLTDHLYMAQLVKESGLSSWHVGESANHLHQAGIIVWEKSRGRKPSLYGFPAATDPAIGVGSTHPEEGVGSDNPTHPDSEDATNPVVGGTTHKESPTRRTKNNGGGGAREIEDHEDQGQGQPSTKQQEQERPAPTASPQSPPPVDGEEEPRGEIEPQEPEHPGFLAWLERTDPDNELRHENGGRALVQASYLRYPDETRYWLGKLRSDPWSYENSKGIKKPWAVMIAALQKNPDTADAYADEYSEWAEQQAAAYFEALAVEQEAEEARRIRAEKEAEEHAEREARIAERKRAYERAKERNAWAHSAGAALTMEERDAIAADIGNDSWSAVRSYLLEHRYDDGPKLVLAPERKAA